MGVLFLPYLCIRSRICSGASNTLPSWFRLWIIAKTGGGGGRELVLCLVKGQVGGIEIWNKGLEGGSKRRSVLLGNSGRRTFFGGNTYKIYTASFCAIPVPAVSPAPR